MRPTCRSVPIVATLLFIIAMSSCVLSPIRTKHTLELPRTPEAWASIWGDARFRLEWHAIGFASQETPLFEHDSSVTVRVPMSAPVIFLAHPEFPQNGPALAPGERLPPAGAIWPLEHTIRGSPIRLSFADGFAASVLAQALRIGIDLRDFNTKRFVELCRAIAESTTMPLDRDRILEALASRSMRESYIRPVESRSLGHTLPHGVWARAAYAAPPLVGGGEITLDLHQGTNVYYSGTGDRLALFVDGKWRVGSGANGRRY